MLNENEEELQLRILDLINNNNIIIPNINVHRMSIIISYYIRTMTTSTNIMYLNYFKLLKKYIKLKFPINDDDADEDSKKKYFKKINMKVEKK